MPGQWLPADGANNLLADRHDEAAVLGQTHELAGPDHAAVWVLPAQERLHANDAASCQFDLGLELNRHRGTVAAGERLVRLEHVVGRPGLVSLQHAGRQHRLHREQVSRLVVNDQDGDVQLFSERESWFALCVPSTGMGNPHVRDETPSTWRSAMLCNSRTLPDHEWLTRRFDSGRGSGSAARP